MNLCDIVDFYLAEILNNRVHSDIYDGKYAAEDVEVTWDNYLGVRKYKSGEFIDDGDDVHGKFYQAPTYAEVLDWLYDKGIIIEFEPCFVFALREHIAYYFNVYMKDENGLTLLFSQKNEMSSFELSIKDIIKKLIEEKYID